jgi:hypothetical protein
LLNSFGHKDAQLVFKRYGHLYPGASRRAVLMLDDLIARTRTVGAMEFRARPMTRTKPCK